MVVHVRRHGLVALILRLERLEPEEPDLVEPEGLADRGAGVDSRIVRAHALEDGVGGEAVLDPAEKGERRRAQRDDAAADEVVQELPSAPLERVISREPGRDERSQVTEEGGAYDVGAGRG